MEKNANIKIKWLTAPEEHDYPAAASYLNLLYEPAVVNNITELLKQAPIVLFKSKDIFRASGLSLLGVSNSHVKKDQKKISSGQALSPLLLVRNMTQGKVIIADGYHRLCAVYATDEDIVVPCKIV